LAISPKSRVGAWKRRLTGKPSFALRRADILSTGLSDEVADVAISVSVVEHGVDLPRFFKEVGRILRNNGRLYMTTDYWPTPIHIPDEPIAFGRSWQPFNRESLLALVDVAQSFGFRLCGPEFDLETEERCVVWAGREYTFVAMQFVKDSRS